MKTKLTLIAFLLFALTCKAQLDTDGPKEIYLLDEKGTQQSLGIFNNSNASGAVLSVVKESTFFDIVKTDDGYYYIINPQNGLYLEPQSNPINIDSKIVQNTPKGNDRQKWQIIPGKRYEYQNYSEQSYYIMPKADDNLYVSIKGAHVLLSKNFKTGTLGFSCFSGSSLVHTSNNEYIPIQDVVKGMSVLTYNNNTMQTEFAVVESLIVHDAGAYALTRLSFVKTDVLLASVNPGFYIQNVDATPNHPILTPNGYKPIGDIHIDDIILFYSDYEAKLVACKVLDVKQNISTEDKVYNLKLENGNSYIVNSVVASPKCPFVSVIENDNLIEISEILRNQLSHNLNIYDMLKIPATSVKNNILKIIIDERKDEITYIEGLYLKIGELIIEPKTTNVISKANTNSNNKSTIILHKGDFIEIVFEIPDNADIDNMILVAKGYYELL